MNSYFHFHSMRRSAGAAVILIGVAGTVSAADDSTVRSTQGKAAIPPAAARPGAARTGSARGPLPDPSLLDGATLAAEKRPETGLSGPRDPADEDRPATIVAHHASAIWIAPGSPWKAPAS